MKKGFWSQIFGNVGATKFKYTIEELQGLFGVLQRNPIVTDVNKALIVETIRSIAEFIIWGDQNEPKMFEFFLENNVMQYLHKLLLQPSNRMGDVAKQVLQTLSIIVQNVKSETGTFFLFSNNHINCIVELKFDFDDEEVLGYYISFLKTISLKLNSRTVQFFFDSRDGAIVFPLYTEAIKFAHHKEGMVRAGVRTLTLSVINVEDKHIQHFITSPPAVHYFTDVAHYLAEQFKILDKRMLMAESSNAQAWSSLDSQIAEVEDMLSYCNDVLNTGPPYLAHMFAGQLWKAIVGPYILKPLLAAVLINESTSTPTSLKAFEEERQAKSFGEPQVRPSCACYVLERIFQHITYTPLLHNLLLVLFMDPSGTSGQQHKAGSSSSGKAGGPPSPPLLHPLEAEEPTGAPTPSATGGVTRPGCRAGLLQVLQSRGAHSTLNSLRALTAVATNKHISPAVMAAVNLLPHSAGAQLLEGCSLSTCAVESAAVEAAAAAYAVARSAPAAAISGTSGKPAPSESAAVEVPSGSAAASAANGEEGNVGLSSSESSSSIDSLAAPSSTFAYGQAFVYRVAWTPQEALGKSSVAAPLPRRQRSDFVGKPREGAAAAQPAGDKVEQLGSTAAVHADKGLGAEIEQCAVNVLNKILGDTLHLNGGATPPGPLHAGKEVSSSEADVVKEFVGNLISSVVTSSSTPTSNPPSSAGTAAATEHPPLEAPPATTQASHTASASQDDSSIPTIDDLLDEPGVTSALPDPSSSLGDLADLRLEYHPTEAPSIAAAAEGTGLSHLPPDCLRHTSMSLQNTPAQVHMCDALLCVLSADMLPVQCLWLATYLLSQLLPGALDPGQPGNSSAAEDNSSSSMSVSSSPPRPGGSSSSLADPDCQPGSSNTLPEASEKSHAAHQAARAAINAAYTVARQAVSEQLGGMWAEAVFPLIHLEWKYSRDGILRPLLNASSEHLLSGPHLYPANPSKPGGSANKGGPGVRETELSTSAVTALYAYHAVQRCVALVQARQLLLTGTVPLAGPPPVPEGEVDVRPYDVVEGQTVDLLDPIPCVVSFKTGQEQRVYFALSGVVMARVASGIRDPKILAHALRTGQFLHSSPAVVLAEPAPTRLHAGFVLSAAPLAGATPNVDRNVSRWVHLHVRPSVRGLLRVIKLSHARRGGVAAAMASLTDGHWVLAFPDGERAAVAVGMVERHVLKLRALYVEALEDMLGC